MFKKLSILFLFIFSALLFTSCGEGESADQQVNKVGTKPAPASQQVAKTTSGYKRIVAAYDVNGNNRDLGEWIGQQPTVVNVWGTWCPPCRREIPDLVRLYGEYKMQGVEIVSLAVKDTPSKVINYSSRNNMDWVMLMFEEPHIRVFGLTGSVPTTIFYNKAGKEVARFIGMRDYNTFKQAFEAILF